MQTCNTSKWIKWAPRYYTNGVIRILQDEAWEYLEFPCDETEEDMRTHIYTFYVDENMFEGADFHGIDIVDIDHPPEEWFDEQIVHFQRELAKNQTMLNHYEDWILTLALEQAIAEQND